MSNKVKIEKAGSDKLAAICRSSGAGVDGMRAALRSVETLSLADMLARIDDLYGRDNLNDECNTEEVRAELASQIRRNFRATHAKVYPDENFWINVIREQERTA